MDKQSRFMFWKKTNEDGIKSIIDKFVKLQFMLDYYKDIQVKNIVFKLKSNMKQAYTRYEYFAINKK